MSEAVVALRHFPVLECLMVNLSSSKVATLLASEQLPRRTVVSNKNNKQRQSVALDVFSMIPSERFLTDSYRMCFYQSVEL